MANCAFHVALMDFVVTVLTRFAKVNVCAVSDGSVADLANHVEAIKHVILAKHYFFRNRGVRYVFGIIGWGGCLW